MVNSKDRQDLKEKIKKKYEILGIKVEVLKELVKPIVPENVVGKLSRIDAINNKSIMKLNRIKQKSNLRL